jgi:hypothetical protein
VLLGENDLLEVLVEDDEGDRALRRRGRGTEANDCVLRAGALSQGAGDARVVADELIVGDVLVATDLGIRETEEPTCCVAAWALLRLK